MYQVKFPAWKWEVCKLFQVKIVKIIYMSKCIYVNYHDILYSDTSIIARGRDRDFCNLQLNKLQSLGGK